MLNLLDDKVTYNFKKEKSPDCYCVFAVSENERKVLGYLRRTGQCVLQDINDFIVLDERFQTFYNLLCKDSILSVHDLIQRKIVSKEDAETIKQSVGFRDIFVICGDLVLGDKLVGAFLDELIDWELECNNLKNSNRRWLIIDDNGVLKLRNGYLPNIRFRHSDRITYDRLRKSILDGYVVINGIGFGLDTSLCDVCYKVSYGRTRYICVTRSVDDLKDTMLYEGLEDDALIVKIVGGVVSIAF